MTNVKTNKTGQDLAGALLDAEAKIGEMLKELPSTQGARTDIEPISSGADKSKMQTVKELGFSQDQSERFQTLAENTDIIEQVKAEAKENDDLPTRTEVLRRVNQGKQDEQNAERADNTAAPPPDGKYKTIVVDPPWPVKKILRDKRPNQGAFDYPTMTIEEIKAFPLADMADESGCHVYMWTTHKFLPTAFEIFQQWGVKYQCLLTWSKNVGMTPFSFMYSTEHVLFGRIGSLDLLKNGERLDFQAKVTKHSEKPEAFYDLVRKVSPGPRIDVFARRDIDGFERYGNE